MTTRSRRRVLLLAEQCNPQWPSLPVVGFKYAVALSRYWDVVVATHVRNEPDVRAAVPHDTEALSFVFIDNERIARPFHRAAQALRRDAQVAWSIEVASQYLPYLDFERRVLGRFRSELTDGRFDLVHRTTPMTPTLPSWIAGRFTQPFVIGPLNGALPWPAAFRAEQRRERERARGLRRVASHLPYAHRTWREADLVLAAFRHTRDDLPREAQPKVVSFPEVGMDPDVFHPPTTPRPTDGTVEFLFVGRLVPYKLPEVAVRAFLGSEQMRPHRLRIVGEGPERPRLQALVDEAGAHERVVIEGSLSQAEVSERMRSADVFVFPSIRELGAGVVVEAMACGLYPLVVDYGGPGELVGPALGTSVPVQPLDDLVLAFRTEMEALLLAKGTRRDIASAASKHALEHFSWDAKARATVTEYDRLLAAVR